MLNERLNRLDNDSVLLLCDVACVKIQESFLLRNDSVYVRGYSQNRFTDSIIQKNRADTSSSETFLGRPPNIFAISKDKTYLCAKNMPEKTNNDGDYR